MKYKYCARTSRIFLAGIIIAILILAGCTKSDLEVNNTPAVLGQNNSNNTKLLKSTASSLPENSGSMTILSSITLRNGVALHQYCWTTPEYALPYPNEYPSCVLISTYQWGGNHYCTGQAVYDLINTTSASKNNIQNRYQVTIPDGTYALRSHFVNQYVCADLNINNSGPLRANRTEVGPWELFITDIVHGGSSSSDKTGIRSIATGKYVSDGSAGMGPMTANGPAPYTFSGAQVITNTESCWDLVQEPYQAIVALKVDLSKWGAGIRYVSAANGSQLKANSTTITYNDNIFDLIYLGNMQIALRSWGCQGQYVCADKSGLSRGQGEPPLFANRTKIGDWETYDMYDLGNNKIALMSHNNYRYVCADLNHGWDAPLYANRDGHQEWETFEVVQLDK